jgi:ribonuclease III
LSGHPLKQIDNNLVLRKLQTAIGYQFKDQKLLEQALSHKSFSSQNNERLEFLGDAALNFIISAFLYENFPGFSEGQLSRTRANLVKGETLAKIAKEFSLGDALLLGSGELKSGGFKRSSILADVVEALIGAVYLESGAEQTRKLVFTFFKDRLDLGALEGLEKDPKTLLQEYLQAKKMTLPDYQVVKTQGKEHEQIFTVRCEISELALSSHGEGKSRRQAEQIAARKVYQLLKKD